MTKIAKPEVKETVEVKVEESQKPKYKKEDLLVIFDELMFSGEYREDIKIKNKLNITFVTRSAAATAEITAELDNKKFNLLSSMHENKALLCICHSLVRYGDKDLSVLSTENRRSFIEKLPSVVVAAISNALVDFDIKTDAALNESDFT